MQTFVHMTAAAIFPLAMVYAAFSDLCSFRIPNWISLVVSVSFLPAAVAAGWNGGIVLVHVGTGAAVLAAGLVLYVRGYLGGGDVKLLAAAGVWVGWQDLFVYLFAVALAGGCLALALIVFRRISLPSILASVTWVRRLHSERENVPYGVAIAIAAIIVFPSLPVVAGFP